MILQSITLPEERCKETELYYRKSGRVVLVDNGLYLEGKALFTTDTYMNIFDCRQWSKYTDAAQLRFVATYCGKGVMELRCVNEKKDELISKYYLESDVNVTVYLDFDVRKIDGFCYCKVFTDSQLQIFDMGYQNFVDGNGAQLGLIICTYKREKQLLDNLSNVYNSDFFDERSELFDKLYIYVVDNASEIEFNDYPNTLLVHNRNTGGSGGFRRGLLEARKNKNITHIIFMDDDAMLLTESLYRLYAFLSFEKQEYCDSMVAGRMFRMEIPYVQYTACEVWNGGDVEHIGFDKDMRDMNNVLECNKGEGEYSGWWFACFSTSYTMKNEPMPFFLHCDDVEYGLRHGGTPIILNGIQVWHEVAQYRQSPIMTYYDWRNSLFVNAELGLDMGKDEIIDKFMNRITLYHVEKKYDYEYMVIRAMEDYLKGRKWLYRIDSERYHKKLQASSGSRYKNAILWRKVKYLIKRN